VADIEVPISLPTDSASVQAAIRVVEGLQDSMKQLGPAAAQGSATAQAQMRAMGAAAQAAQKQIAAGRASGAVRQATGGTTPARDATEQAAREQAAAAAAKAAIKDVDAARAAAAAAEKARIKERTAEEKKAAKAQKDAAREVEKTRKEADDRAKATRANNAAALDATSQAAQEAAARIIAVVKAVIDLAVSFSAAMIKAQAFKEATTGAFTKLLGSAAAADKAFRDTIKTADAIGMSYEDALRGVNSLIAKGFKADAAQELVKAMADLKSVVPDANIGNLLLAITQIKSKGVLQMEELQGQIAEAGLSVSVVLEEIGKKIGKSGAEVRKMIAAGKISADQGVQGILAAIQKTTGKPIGKAAEEASQSLGGLIQRLLQIPQGLFLMADASEGVAKIKDVLKNVLAAFGPASVGGQALSASFGELGNSIASVFESLTGAKGASALETIALGAAKGISLLAAGIKRAAPYVPLLAKGLLGLAAVMGFVMAPLIAAASLVGGAVLLIIATLGKLVEGALWLGGAIKDAFASVKTTIASFGASIFGDGQSIGANLARGVVAGIMGGLPGIMGAAAQMVGAATSSAQGAGRIKSPSRLWRDEVGYQLSSGAAVGVGQGAGAVDRAAAGMVGSSTAAASSAVSGGGGRSITMNFSAGSIVLHAPPGSNGRAFAAEFFSALEELA
jgi:tape measure domain-containing protein